MRIPVKSTCNEVCEKIRLSRLQGINFFTKVYSIDHVSKNGSTWRCIHRELAAELIVFKSQRVPINQVLFLVQAQGFLLQINGKLPLQKWITNWYSWSSLRPGAMGISAILCNLDKFSSVPLSLRVVYTQSYCEAMGITTAHIRSNSTPWMLRRRTLMFQLKVLALPTMGLGINHLKF